MHETHEHDNHEADHDHKFVDLVDTIFKASNEDHDSDKVPTTKTKIKKHTTSEVLTVLTYFLKKAPAAFFALKTVANLGHLKVPDVPPKNSLC
jgi:hypothetical protein